VFLPSQFIENKIWTYHLKKIYLNGGKPLIKYDYFVGIIINPFVIHVGSWVDSQQVILSFFTIKFNDIGTK